MSCITLFQASRFGKMQAMSNIILSVLNVIICKTKICQFLRTLSFTILNLAILFSLKLVEII